MSNGYSSWDKAMLVAELLRLAGGSVSYLNGSAPYDVVLKALLSQLGGTPTLGDYPRDVWGKILKLRGGDYVAMDSEWSILYRLAGTVSGAERGAMSSDRDLIFQIVLNGGL